MALKGGVRGGKRPPSLSWEKGVENGVRKPPWSSLPATVAEQDVSLMSETDQEENRRAECGHAAREKPCPPPENPIIIYSWRWGKNLRQTDEPHPARLLSSYRLHLSICMSFASVVPEAPWWLQRAAWSGVLRVTRSKTAPQSSAAGAQTDGPASSQRQPSKRI